MRAFQGEKISKKSFALWAIESLESAYERVSFLQKRFPHFTVINNTDNLFIIEDNKARKLVKVEWKGTHAVCNEKDCEQYITFALLHPEMRLR